MNIISGSVPSRTGARGSSAASSTGEVSRHPESDAGDAKKTGLRRSTIQKAIDEALLAYDEVKAQLEFSKHWEGSKQKRVTDAAANRCRRHGRKLGHAATKAPKERF